MKWLLAKVFVRKLQSLFSFKKENNYKRLFEEQCGISEMKLTKKA